MAGDTAKGHTPTGFADSVLKAGIGLALFVGAAAIVIWFIMWLFGAIPTRQTVDDPPGAIPSSSRTINTQRGRDLPRSSARGGTNVERSEIEYTNKRCRMSDGSIGVIGYLGGQGYCWER